MRARACSGGGGRFKKLRRESLADCFVSKGVRARAWVHPVASTHFPPPSRRCFDQIDRRIAGALAPSGSGRKEGRKKWVCARCQAAALGELSVVTPNPGLPRLKRKEGEKRFLRCKRGGWARGDAGERLFPATASLASLPKEGRGDPEYPTSFLPRALPNPVVEVEAAAWCHCGEGSATASTVPWGLGPSSEPRF